MSLDLNAIKAKLNQLTTTNDRKNNYFRPEPGKQRVRIVPYVHRKENPFLEMYFHYDIAKRSMLSPITFGNADPVVEFAEKLKKTGDKDDWLMGRKIEPKMRTYVPVVVRGKESEGVKFWGFGKTIYSELLSIIADPDYGDIADPVNGRDVMVEFLTAEETGANFPKTNIRVKPNQTPITDNKALLETVLKEQKDIAEVYQELSYDELAEALNDWLNPSEDGDDSSTKDETVPASTLPAILIAEVKLPSLASIATAPGSV